MSNTPRLSASAPEEEEEEVRNLILKSSKIFEGKRSGNPEVPAFIIERSDIGICLAKTSPSDAASYFTHPKFFRKVLKVVYPKGISTAPDSIKLYGSHIYSLFLAANGKTGTLQRFASDTLTASTVTVSNVEEGRILLLPVNSETVLVVNGPHLLYYGSTETGALGLISPKGLAKELSHPKFSPPPQYHSKFSLLQGLDQLVLIDSTSTGMFQTWDIQSGRCVFKSQASEAFEILRMKSQTVVAAGSSRLFLWGLSEDPNPLGYPTKALVKSVDLLDEFIVTADVTGKLMIHPRSQSRYALKSKEIEAKPNPHVNVLVVEDYVFHTYEDTLFVWNIQSKLQDPLPLFMAHIGFPVTDLKFVEDAGGEADDPVQGTVYALYAKRGAPRVLEIDVNISLFDGIFESIFGVRLNRGDELTSVSSSLEHVDPEELSKLRPLTVYSSTGCKHCSVVKASILEKGLSFVEINIDDFPMLRPVMVEHAKKRSVPQVFFGSLHIGGENEVLALLESNWFTQLSQMNNLPVPDWAVPPKKIRVTTPQSVVEEALVEVVDPELLKAEQLFDDIRYAPKDKTIKVKTHTVGISSRHFKTFKGGHLFNWLRDYHNLKKTQEILQAGNLLLKYHFIAPVASGKGVISDVVNGKSLYRFVADKDKYILNMRRAFRDTPRPANQVAKDLQKQALQMTDKFVSGDGNYVDYERLKKSSDFKKFQRTAVELQSIDLTKLDTKSLKAFYINIYNVLVIHATAVLGPPKNMFQRKTFFSTTSYLVGGYRFSLNKIEHGFLRNNTKPPGSYSRLIGKRDPQTALCVPKDPLIHFVLNCGASSCPPIRIVDAENLDQALQWGAEGFIDDEVTVNLKKRTITLSMLFSWYRVDFGKNDEEVLAFLDPYLKHRSDWVTIRSGKKKPTIKYATYDWDSNGRGTDGPENLDDFQGVSQSSHSEAEEKIDLSRLSISEEASVSGYDMSSMSVSAPGD